MNGVQLMGKDEIALALKDLASRMVERHSSHEDIMLVGIQRRGADLERRLAGLAAAALGRDIALGTLDINLYRDDWSSIEGKPQIGQSCIPGTVDGRTVILVDDVLFSGRTVRAALDALLDYGRPRVVELLVLIDRGHRELPIQADYAGRVVKTEPQEHVDVFLEERDGRDAVLLISPSAH